MMEKKSSGLIVAIPIVMPIGPAGFRLMVEASAPQCLGGNDESKKGDLLVTYVWICN
jgi:hypothetical protein